MRIYIEASDFSLFESMIFYGKLDCTWVKVNPPRSRVPVGKRIYIYIYISRNIIAYGTAEIPCRDGETW